MRRVIDDNFLPHPKAAPRWKGLALKLLFWLAAYGISAVALLGLLDVMKWR